MRISISRRKARWPNSLPKSSICSCCSPITRRCIPASSPSFAESSASRCSSNMDPTTLPPEHNVTGIDYSDRLHLRYAGPILDIHAHVFQTRPSDPKDGPPLGVGPGASLDQAEIMLQVAEEFGIVHTVSMCPADDIAPLRARVGDRIGFNGSISKKNKDAPDDEAYRLLDHFLEQGVEIIKFWSAPRGRE